MNNNENALNLMTHVYNLSCEKLTEFEIKYSGDEIEYSGDEINSYNNTTLINYIKEKLQKEPLINNIYNGKVEEKGIYLFELEITTTKHPNLPIGYSFCYVNDVKPYVILNYSSNTKMHFLQKDINILLNNLSQIENLVELFKPDYFEQYLFEDIISVKNITYNYLTFNDLTFTD